MLSLESRVNGRQVVDGAEQQAGADCDDDGEGGFNHDEPATQVMAGSTGGAACPGLQHARGDVRACVQHGRESEEEPADHRDDDGHEQHTRVDPDVLDARQAVGIGAYECLEAGPRDDHRERAAREREQHTLGQTLAQDRAPAGAERGQDGEFTLTALGAGDEQVRDVGAGDQQH